MSTFDDRDVLAAIGAIKVGQPTDFRDVRLHDAGYLVGAEYDGDTDDNVDRLIKRGLIEPATTVDLNGLPLGEYGTPPVVRMTQAGWFELWRH